MYRYRPSISVVQQNCVPCVLALLDLIFQEAAGRDFGHICLRVNRVWKLLADGFVKPRQSSARCAHTTGRRRQICFENVLAVALDCARTGFT